MLCYSTPDEIENYLVMEKRSFFAELKRRNVIRAAGLYLVGAWLLTQVASSLARFS